MRNLTKDQQRDQRVSEFLKGLRAQTCGYIALQLQESPFDVRASLLRLKEAGEVIEIRAPDRVVYERSHGGYSPGPEAA